jgi:hypothetical protein
LKNICCPGSCEYVHSRKSADKFIGKCSSDISVSVKDSIEKTYRQYQGKKIQKLKIDMPEPIFLPN